LLNVAYQLLVTSKGR